jgi:hypothetical protein
MPGLLHLGCRPARWGSLPSYDKVERQLIPLAPVTLAVAEMAVGAGIWKMTEPPRSCGCAKLVRGGGKAVTGDADKSGGHDLAAMGAFADHGCIQSCSPAQRFQPTKIILVRVFFGRGACAGYQLGAEGAFLPPYPLNWRGSSLPPWGTSISTKMDCQRRAPSAHGCVNLPRRTHGRGCGAAGKPMSAST